MLNSNSSFTIKRFINVLMISALALLYSCMPQSQGPGVNSAKNTNNNGTPTTPTTYGEPSYPLNGTFVQQGSTQTLTNFSLPIDFNDSFLIRGSVLSKYLRTIPNTTKFCIVGQYTYIPGNDRFLVMAAKPNSTTDLVNKTTEFYLQVEPSNDMANQNDCLSYNLTNALFENAASPTVHFSLNQLCENCTTAVSSGGLRLYFVNGETVANVATNSLVLTVSGSTTTPTAGCSENTSCKARGFDCCLQAQCVNDGALRPNAINLPGFEVAKDDVQNNPNRFTLYPQFYYVCETRPEGEVDNNPPTTTDPAYEAAVRILELKQLYDCLNKVDGEFSHCTLKYTQADQMMPGTFNPSLDGFKDDITFSSLNPTFGSGDKANNIYRIIYAGTTVYEQDKVALPSATFGTPNDNLSSAQTVTLNLPLPANARDANLYITYKVDGTCERLSSTLTKCSKTYIQSHSDLNSTFWHDSSKTYILPSYADVSSSAAIIVKVGGIVVPEDPGTTWSKSSSPKAIVFSGAYPIFQNQTIEITYYVNSSAAELVKFKQAAQAKVNTICTCAGTTKCNLKPVMNGAGTEVVNYECVYPTATSDEPPTNQKVYVSNKNIAHRYYDTSGVSYDEDYGSAPAQEGTAFAYTNNDVLKPNNVTSPVGFNEIYGSFAKSGTYISKPAKLVRVKKDKLYDIITTTGGFSSCPTCGTDYYNALQRIFPQNFPGQGGGYTPDNYASSRLNNTGTYRSDDILFGRACFVPATMIPWTHVTGSSPAAQRKARLANQHFLFANGYNRDWYGFDYGSLIGSFDGVSWFSIGNQRRIKASSGKLFLAVNAYVGDLNTDNNFTVLVSESTAFSSEIPDHDTESDGAECQRSHFCSNDNDCFRQLGYDYSCQNVASLSTPWPQFDANGSEVIGSNVRTLLSLVGGSNGQAKRCVYRGRGTPCLQNLSAYGSGDYFNGTNTVGHLNCSPNNSCVALSNPGKFNDRIARFANTPTAQNTANAASTVTDTVGLGARIILRPFDYYGTANVATSIRTTLAANKVTAICTPGKDLSIGTTVLDLNSSTPSVRTDSSDKILGVGPTFTGLQSSRYLNACPATDAAGITMQTYPENLGSEAINKFTIAQNMSSNLLNLSPLVTLKIFSSNAGSQVTTAGYQKNTCLRAPGASCFSDLECAPSAFASAKAKSATTLINSLNEPEVKFWHEELICGNPEFKTVNGGLLNPDFDLKKNKCCRDFGKTFTVFTQPELSTAPTFEWCDTSNRVSVAGVTKSISSNTRYSRVHTGYDKMTCDINQVGSGTTFALSLEAPNASQRYLQIQTQYKTLDTVNSRTCCTSNWVRSFATENGGGHAFTRAKFQNIDVSMFKSLSWTPDNDTTIPGVSDGQFTCDSENFANASCEIKSLTPTEEQLYLTWAASLELVGIPQVAIKTNDEVFRLVGDSQEAVGAIPLRDSNNREIIRDVNAVGADFTDTSVSPNKRYFSAANYDKLNMVLTGSKNSMKKVFSENEFNCCISTGQEVPETTTASQCCTGFVANVGQRRCCLPDFTDVTLYLNRYVSSEGRGLPDSAYDPNTGYIKDPGQVRLLAGQKNICCSGNAMTGFAISQLPIPIDGGGIKMPPDMLNTTRRFHYMPDSPIDDNVETGNIGRRFKEGLRWNNHIYCVPEGFGQ